MPLRTPILALTTLICAPAVMAQDGDAAWGGLLFDRQCVSCHVVADADGALLAGRNARTGPNLYAVTTRGIAQAPDYRYGEALAAVGAAGAQWSQDAFVAYVMDPTDWLRDQLDDRRARSKMAFKVRSADDALHMFTYLDSLAQAAE